MDPRGDGAATERERLIEESLARPGFYSPGLHLAALSLGGLAIAGGAAALVRGVGPAEIAFAGAVVLLCNAVEWLVHRHVMHRRRWFAPSQFERHALLHHRVYTGGRMAIARAGELRLVLLKAWLPPALLVALAPVLVPLWLLGGHNLAAIFAAVSMAYVVAYEWVHLACHLPEGSAIGSLALVRSLRANHAMHHDDPERGFNVTAPIVDWIAGTRARPPGAAR